MQKLDIIYLRYADDWIIMAKTKYKLRKAVKKCKQILNRLKLSEHPDKTDYRNYNNIAENNNYKSKQPFNFLGIEFNHLGAIDIKKETKQKFYLKISGLYELVLALMKMRNQISKETRKGRKIIRKIQMLELLIICKMQKSYNGLGNYLLSLNITK
ncbi:MAG: hypothetical protein Kow0076_1760 [Francisella sp.]